MPHSFRWFLSVFKPTLCQSCLLRGLKGICPSTVANTGGSSLTTLKPCSILLSMFARWSLGPTHCRSHSIVFVPRAKVPSSDYSLSLSPHSLSLTH